MRVVLEARSLLALDVVEQLDRAVHDEDRSGVHRVEPERPAPAKRLHRLDVGNDEVPIERAPSPCGRRSTGNRYSGSHFSTFSSLGGHCPLGRDLQPGASEPSRHACSGFRTSGRPSLSLDRLVDGRRATGLRRFLGPSDGRGCRRVRRGRALAALGRITLISRCPESVGLDPDAASARRRRRSDLT